MPAYYTKEMSEHMDQEAEEALKRAAIFMGKVQYKNMLHLGIEDGITEQMCIDVCENNLREMD